MNPPITRITGATAAVAAVAALALAAGSAAALPSGETHRASSSAALGGSSTWQHAKWGDDTDGDGARAKDLNGVWAQDKDLGSMAAIARQTFAAPVWGQTDGQKRKITGQGVGVALIDTGVTPVPGLDARGKLVQGPDLSYDSQSDGTRHLDAFGHGTHMAGIIAGSDAATGQEGGNGKDNQDGKDGGGDPKAFRGEAPGATIISVKVGAADGGVDVSQVVAGIDWVVQHRAETGTRVLSLSYGTRSTQSARLDPLAHAVENAWRAGIVVVVAAGNDGEDGGTTLTMPAVDPYVIAVGSSDNNGSDKAADDTVGRWTNPGTDVRRPDLLAPGKSVVSLRVPGGFIDTAHPEGRIDGDTSGRFFRGTGTSQSTAVVAGAVALLLQAQPSLTPDQVKAVLKASADRLKHDGSPAQGAGELDVKGAVALAKGRLAASAQSYPASTGLGSLEASRGGEHVVDPATGDALVGERDGLGSTWVSAAWAADSSAQTSWDGGAFEGRMWTGDSWTGDDWSGRMWTGRMWTGQDWSGRMWTGRMWTGSSWDGRMWTAGDWSGRMWTGRMWTGRMWTDLIW